jgi:hypothetical protein
MNCKNRNCKKELPEGHRRVYCDTKCMQAEGHAKQAERYKKNAIYGICIVCGDSTRKSGRHIPKYCRKPECQEVRNKEIAKRQVDRSRDYRETKREERKSGTESVLLPDGSIPEYYLTRGDPFTHGICSR